MDVLRRIKAVVEKRYGALGRKFVFPENRGGIFQFVGFPFVDTKAETIIRLLRRRYLCFGCHVYLFVAVKSF